VGLNRRHEKSKKTTYSLQLQTLASGLLEKKFILVTAVEAHRFVSGRNSYIFNLGYANTS
jgi:hypothetical protein